MKVGDLVKNINSDSGLLWDGVIGNAGYHSFTDGGWIIRRVSDGRSTLCDKIDMELVSESR